VRSYAEGCEKRQIPCNVDQTTRRSEITRRYIVLT
jgi:hypothetical protein